MAVIFLTSLTMLPLNLARNMEQAHSSNVTESFTSTHGILVGCDMFCLVDVGLRCFTGHLNLATKEVYLSPRRIFWYVPKKLA